MKYLFGATALILFAYWSYSAWQANLEEAERLAELVTRDSRLEECRTQYDWLPSLGETVTIKVDGSSGMVVFIAFDSFESYEMAWIASEKVDPNECDVFGVDVRTSKSRVIDQSFDGELERIVEPYAVVRFELFEIQSQLKLSNKLHRAICGPVSSTR